MYSGFSFANRIRNHECVILNRMVNQRNLCIVFLLYPISPRNAIRPKGENVKTDTGFPTGACCYFIILMLFHRKITGCSSSSVFTTIYGHVGSRHACDCLSGPISSVLMIMEFSVRYSSGTVIL